MQRNLMIEQFKSIGERGTDSSVGVIQEFIKLRNAGHPMEGLTCRSPSYSARIWRFWGTFAVP